MLTPSSFSAPSQKGKSQRKTLTSRDPVSGEQISAFTFAAAAYNLVRLPKLLEVSA